MDAITWGKLLLLMAVPVLLIALLSGVEWARHSGYGLGTPQYARTRVARRTIVYAAIVTVLLLAIALLTPLWEMELA